MELNSLLLAISSIAATALSIVTAGLIALLSIQYSRAKSLIFDANQIVNRGEALRNNVKTLAQLKFFDQNQLKIKIQIYRSILHNAKSGPVGDVDYYYDKTKMKLYDFGNTIKDDILEFIELARKDDSIGDAERIVSNLESIYHEQDFDFKNKTLETINEARLHTNTAGYKLKELEDIPSLNKRYLQLIFIAIALVFFITVIYPIGLTPINSFSDLQISIPAISNGLFRAENIFLTLIFLSITSVLYYSYWHLTQLIFPDELKESLENESKFENIKAIHDLYRDSFTYSEDIGKHFA